MISLLRVFVVLMVLMDFTSYFTLYYYYHNNNKKSNMIQTHTHTYIHTFIQITPRSSQYANCFSKIFAIREGNKSCTP